MKRLNISSETSASESIFILRCYSTTILHIIGSHKWNEYIEELDMKK